MGTFHLVTTPAITCQAGICQRQAVVCNNSGTSFWYLCTEHATDGIKNREACLNLANALLSGVGIGAEVVYMEPFAMAYERQSIPGAIYRVNFLLPGTQTPVFHVDLWAARDGAVPDVLNALAAMCYNAFEVTDEDDEMGADALDREHFADMRRKADHFVDTWQRMLAAVQHDTGSCFDLTDFLMTTVRQWA